MAPDLDLSRRSGNLVPAALPDQQYSVAASGACSYTYRNSSAVAAEAVFGVHSSVLWRIETSDPTFGIDSVRTWSSSQVAVAEVQAVVTG